MAGHVDGVPPGRPETLSRYHRDSWPRLVVCDDGDRLLQPLPVGCYLTDPFSAKEVIAGLAVARAEAEAERVRGGPLPKQPTLITDNSVSCTAQAFNRHLADLTMPHVRLRYRTPQQLGLLERFHAVLKQEEVYWNLYTNPADGRENSRSSANATTSGPPRTGEDRHPLVTGLGTRRQETTRRQTRSPSLQTTTGNRRGSLTTGTLDPCARQAVRLAGEGTDRPHRAPPPWPLRPPSSLPAVLGVKGCAACGGAYVAGMRNVGSANRSNGVTGKNAERDSG